MSEPVKIVVTAQTAEAAANLEKFLAGAGDQFGKAKKVADEATSAFGQNRMAIMELGHSARSMADGLAAGMNPLRLLAMESPRITEALAFMGVKLAALGPYALAAAAAGGVFAVEWYGMVGNIEDSTKATEDFIKAMNEVPKILEKIQTLTRAGLLSGPASNEALDYLTGRKKLYVGPDGQPTTQASGLRTAVNITQGGPVAFATPGATTETPNAILTDQTKINEWVEKNIPQISEEQAKAIAKNRELEKQAHEQALSESEERISKIHDEFERKRQEILETAKIEGAPLSFGGVRDPEVDKRAANAVADLNYAEQAAVAKVRDEEAQKAQERINQQARDLKAQIEQQNRESEALIEKQKQESLELVKQANLRREIADEAIKLKIAEVQGNDNLSPQEKAAAIEKLLNEQSDLLGVQIKELEVQKDATTDLTKQLEIEKQIYDLKIQQANLKPKEDKNDLSFSGQLSDQWDKLQKQTGNLAGDAASVVVSPFVGMRNGFDQAINDMIEKGTTFKRAMGEVSLAIEKSFIQAVANMAADFITNTAMMLVKEAANQTGLTALFAAGTEARTAIHASGESQMTIFTAIGSVLRQGWHLAETVFHGVMVALRVAAHEAGELFCTAVTYAQAMLRAMYHAIVAAIAAIESEASVPYVGVVLGIAAGAAIMAAAMGLMGGFEGGGYTGDGATNEVAGVVHRQEFVVPAHAVNRIGVANLTEMVNNSSPRGSSGNSSSGSSHGRSSNVSVYSYTDPNKMAQHIEKNPDHEKYIVEVMSRNIHKFRS